MPDQRTRRPRGSGNNRGVRTVVVQSYRRHDVPPWIARCLASVASWAGAHGHTYRFVGDEMFDLLPPRYRLRTSHHVQMLADLGRLLLARDLLAEGFDRAIWLDADLLVTAPDAFAIPTAQPFYLCREVWVELEGGVPRVSERVNNCACSFTAAATFLPFYIDACQQLVRDTAGALSPLLVGTTFLSALDRVLPLPKLRDVALVSPHMLLELAAGGGPCLEAYRERFASPIRAANLCASFRGLALRDAAGRPVVLDDACFDRALGALSQYR